MRSHDPHPVAVGGLVAVVGVVQHLLGKSAVFTGGLPARPKVGRHVAARHEKGSVTGHIASQDILQFRRKRFERIPRHTAPDSHGALFAQNQVDCGILLR